MRKGNLLFSAVQFLFAILVILLGVFLIGLQKASHLRFALSALLADQSCDVAYLGGIVLFCGILLLIGFAGMYRGRYYQVKMGEGLALVELSVIEECVQRYWKDLLPGQATSSEVVLKSSQRLEIFVEMPQQSPEAIHVILKQAEKDLTALLKLHLNYQKRFVLSVLVK